MKARTLALVLFVAANGSMALACWSLKSVAGRRGFDEMAGNIPLHADTAGVLPGLFERMDGWFAWRPCGRTGAR